MNVNTTYGELLGILLEAEDYYKSKELQSIKARERGAAAAPVAKRYGDPDVPVTGGYIKPDGKIHGGDPYRRFLHYKYHKELGFSSGERGYDDALRAGHIRYIHNQLSDHLEMDVNPHHKQSVENAINMIRNTGTSTVGVNFMDPGIRGRISWFKGHPDGAVDKLRNFKPEDYVT